MNNKVENFFSKFPLAKYKSGKIILGRGDDTGNIYFIKKGLVRQYASLSNNSEKLIINIFRPGCFILMAWMVEKGPSKYYFEAATDVEIKIAPLLTVKKFLKDNPDVLFDLTERILKGLDGFVSRVGFMVFDEAYAKISKLLSYFAKKYGVIEGKNLILKIPFTHREIASWVGITRETASLQMESLEKKGIISYKGRRLIINNLTELGKDFSVN